MVSFRSLEHAKQVAELGSFSAAARALGVLQPTVSATISDLESDLKVRLFVRSRSGVTLTEAGQHLLPAITQALIATAHVASLAEQYSTSLTIRVGLTPLVGATRVADLLRPFEAATPSMTFNYQQGSNIELQNQLRNGSIDLAFSSLVPRTPGISRQLVCVDRLRVVGKSRTRRKQVSVSELGNKTILLTEDACGLATATRNAFANENIDIRVYDGTARDHVTLLEWAKLGLGTAIVPEEHAPKTSPLLTDANAVVTIASYAMWRKDLLTNELGTQLVRHLRTVLPQSH
jgi:DNA-binding transcriptional LysR family regulator